jgi:4'-phosphopantetheinyl transferase
MAPSAAIRTASPTAGSRWIPGPSWPELADGGLHVWLADLATAPESIQRLLSESERGRAGEILSGSRRRLWARSHGILRDLLGRYLRSEPSALALSTPAGLRPRLTPEAAPGPQPPLAFSLSHSGSLALYAFAVAPTVGVDVETSERTLDERALAGRAFPADEAARISALAPDARRREFLRSWTRREAVLKLSGPHSESARASGADRDEDTSWTSMLDLEGRAYGTVALERPPAVARFWSWSPATDADFAGPSA